jgi:uncharacterized protein (UPF0276 family)
MMNNMRSRFPALGFGLGLRAQHYAHVLEHKPKVDWFEVISENFIENFGKARRLLHEVRAHYPVVLHGVGLSIGSTDPLNLEYLAKLKALAEEIHPAWISDHLCWTGINHQNTHDLLPVPYTEEALAHIIPRIKAVQDYLERPILLENPSTYLEFKDSRIPEAEFIRQMAEEADCVLLLDVNNVYVTCYNHRLDPKSYIDTLPLDRVVQIHLAGHHNKGNHIVDTHDDHVIDEVWELYRYVIGKTGMVATMVEWDDNIPEFSVLEEELGKARKVVSEGGEARLPKLYAENPRVGNTNDGFAGLMERMHGTILKPSPSGRGLGEGRGEGSLPELWIHPKKDFPPEAQLNVYIKGYRLRLFDVVSDEYSILRYAMGDDHADNLFRSFIEATSSHSENIGNYIYLLPKFIENSPILLPHKPFMLEIARLESALSQVVEMANTPPLGQEDLAGITPEHFMEMQLEVRPALFLFAFEYPVNDYVRAFFEGEKPSIPQLGKSCVAVYRNRGEVWRLPLLAEEYHFLNAVREGKTVAQAMEAVAASSSLEEEALLAEVGGWFGGFIRNGLLGKKNELRHCERSVAIQPAWNV